MKSLRLFLIVTFVLAGILVVAPTQAQAPPTFSCKEYASWLSGTVPAVPGAAFGTFGTFEEGVAYTFNIKSVGGTAVNVSLVADPAGATVLAGPANVPVTFSYVMDSQPGGLGVLVNSAASGQESISISVSCGGGGCDLLPIPETAVVGSFNWDAEVFWAPGEPVTPTTVIHAGNTAWVLGEDASGQYYKIIWSCDYLWVPVSTMGPDYDDVWQGRPLPTEVVE